MRAIAGAWGRLTASERRAVLVVASLALLGLVARYWHLRGERPDPVPPPEQIASP